MFEWLFKYPAPVFRNGDIVLLAGWPLWMLGAAVTGKTSHLVCLRRGIRYGFRHLGVDLDNHPHHQASRLFLGLRIGGEVELLERHPFLTNVTELAAHA